MNEDQNKSQINSNPAGTKTETQTSPEQTEQRKRPTFAGISDTPQKPLRTFESDIAEIMGQTSQKDKNALLQKKVAPVEDKPQPEIKKGGPQPTPIKIPVNIPVKVVKNQSTIQLPTENPSENRFATYVGNAIPKTEDHPLHVLKNQTEPKHEPVPAPIPKPEPKLEKSVENLRTYEGDIANMFTEKKPTVLTMAMAESQRRGDGNTISNTQAKQGGKNVFLILISTILLLGGAGGLYYAYLKYQSSKQTTIITPTTKTTVSILNTNSQKEIDITNLKKDFLIKTISSELKNHTSNQGQIMEYVLNQTKEGVKNRVGSTQFIELLNLSVNDVFKRSLNEKWLLGAYSHNDRNVPFIILKTDFFQNSFAGMLRWETSMPEEMADVFGYRSIANQNSGNSTTTSIQLLYNINGSFKDKIIANRDIREFIDKNNNMLILYTFLDKDTLLITTSETVVPAIIDRIEKQSYVR